MNVANDYGNFLFVTDYIIERLQAQHNLMKFISKNLSWGIFRDTFSSTVPQESVPFYEYYLESMKKSHIICAEPELLLFTIIELIGSTCYNCIILEQPVSMDKYLPYLHQSILQIFRSFTEREQAYCPKDFIS